MHCPPYNVKCFLGIHHFAQSLFLTFLSVCVFGQKICVIVTLLSGQRCKFGNFFIILSIFFAFSNFAILTKTGGCDAAARNADFLSDLRSGQFLFLI